jgi:hypothetical protein
VTRTEEIGERDGWRCWLCDEPVDPKMSVNDDRGPSVDACITKAKSKSTGVEFERLAHRGCNTKKGAIAAVVPWPSTLFVFDASPIITTVDRLQRKGGREVVARCPTKQDAQEAADWLVDRISRLRPDMAVSTAIEPAGSQFLLIVKA